MEWNIRALVLLRLEVSATKDWTVNVSLSCPDHIVSVSLDKKTDRPRSIEGFSVMLHLEFTIRHALEAVILHLIPQEYWANVLNEWHIILKTFPLVEKGNLSFVVLPLSYIKADLHG